MEFITKLLDWQKNFEGEWITQPMREHTEIPVVFVTGYLALVFYGRDLMQDRKPMNLKTLFTLWNFILSAFSILGVIHTAPLILETLSTKGFKYTVCADPSAWYYNGPSGLWVALFVLSKIPEFVDTVFLVFQKKPVIFLHWYHHTTVMLYCWHAYTHVVGPGMWFAAMNYFVHSIMYGYYFLMNLSGFTRKLVKPLAQTITTLQLLQMVVGMVVTVASFMWYDSSKGKESCYIDPANMRMGLIMYTSYFVLFASLFHKLYLSKSKKSQKAAAGEADICTATMDAMRNGPARDAAAKKTA